MTNKKVIDMLVKYFLSQDPEKVATLLACCMIDLKRVNDIEELPDDERERLEVRLVLNAEQLIKFSKEKEHKELTLNFVNV